MRQQKLPPGVYMQLSSPEALRAWMLHKGYSYADLGQMVGVSKQFIHKLATGQKRTCRPGTAARIEMVLLPPKELRGPGDLPLFVARGSGVDGDSVQKRRSPRVTSRAKLKAPPL